MSNFGKRTFHYSGITLLNSLPINLKESKSLEHIIHGEYKNYIIHGEYKNNILHGEYKNYITLR
jgi:hypothetical protein